MKRGILLFYLTSLIFLLISIFFDNKIAVFFAQNRIRFVTSVMFWLDFLGEWFVVLFFISVLFLVLKEKRKMLPYAWLSFFFSMILIRFMKLGIARPRPETALLATDTYSFPSGHATGAFSVLNFFDKYRVVWLVFALLIAFSRIYLGMHYLSDVVAGALIGYTISLLIIRLKNKKNNKLKNKK